LTRSRSEAGESIVHRARSAALRGAFGRGLAAALSLACAGETLAQQGQGLQLIEARLQKRADALITILGFTVTPDVTTGSLSISDKETGNPDVAFTSVGGGFTVSKDVPLYLEGTAAAARYDPTFVATDGTETKSIPVKWNSVSATGGIGWDFPIAENLKLRPILNFTLGHLESDLSVAGRIIQSQTDAELDFLKNGRKNVFGLGGSLMLDYERYKPENEIDVELRYTNIVLKSYGGTFPAVQGRTDAQTIGLWSRWRAPTGIDLLDRPLRYVLEYAFTSFLGDLDGALGFNYLNSFGVGLELDSSKYDIIVTRTRLVMRYKIGHDVSGWSLGFAVSF
jgi:hypothetical protein